MASPILKKALVNALLLILALSVSFGAGEVIVRVIYGDSVSLFPRYHADYRYGDYTLRGIRPNAVFRHTSADGSWEFITNNRGFRNTRDFEYQKPAGTIRVLSLGDSHTQGYEVRQEATFSAVLQRYLTGRGRKTEVINAGVSGFSTAEALAFLENEGVRYEPDIVVLGFYANDFEDNLKAGLFGLDETSSLVALKQEHIPGVKIQNFIYAIPLMKWLGENSYFYSLLFNTTWQHFKKKLARKSRGTEDDGFEYAIASRHRYSDLEIRLATALIQRMLHFCNARGIRLIVVDIPVREGSYLVSSSLPKPVVENLETAGVELILSDALLGPFSGAVEMHRPNGAHHISEFTHGLIGVELGRRMPADARFGAGSETEVVIGASTTPGS
jgi:hypothetical protein